MEIKEIIRKYQEQPDLTIDSIKEMLVKHNIPLVDCCVSYTHGNSLPLTGIVYFEEGHPSFSFSLLEQLEAEIIRRTKETKNKKITSKEKEI